MVPHYSLAGVQMAARHLKAPAPGTSQADYFIDWTSPQHMCSSLKLHNPASARPPPSAPRHIPTFTDFLYPEQTMLFVIVLYRTLPCLGCFYNTRCGR